MDYPDFSLKNRIALVTGASKGIGYGLAKAIANAGATVLVAARTTSSGNTLSRFKSSRLSRPDNSGPSRKGAPSARLVSSGVFWEISQF